MMRVCLKCGILLLEGFEAVEAAANELEARGYQLIHAARTEPWTQTITRLLSP